MWVNAWQLEKWRDLFNKKKNLPTLGNCGADISQVQRKEENKKWVIQSHVCLKENLACFYLLADWQLDQYLGYMWQIVHCYQSIIIYFLLFTFAILCLYLRQNQGILIETMQQENAKFAECHAARNLLVMVKLIFCHLVNNLRQQWMCYPPNNSNISFSEMVAREGDLSTGLRLGL